MKRIFPKIEGFLNAVTMYRLVLFALAALALVAIALSALDFIHYNPLSLIISLVLSVAVCYTANRLFAKTLGVPINPESSLISALILFFIVSPVQTLYDAQIIAAAGLLAMLSKYLLAFRGKHLFNPVAIAVLALGLLGVGSVSWWVASQPLFIFVLVLSLVIVHKIGRFHLFGAFLSVSALILTLRLLSDGESLWNAILLALMSWPTVFFAGVMLTEPLTAPPTKNLRVAYGLIVAALFSLSFSFGPLYSTPELALVVGNIFSFLFALKGRIFLTLIQKQEVAKNIFEFSFRTNRELKFKAGQYLEFTLSHKHPDSRGSRRYFTICSSPTEDELKIGVKFNTPGSSFKRRLLALERGEQIAAGGPIGDFVLPEDPASILVFVAGGIGITPFRSMVKYMLNTRDQRQIALFYNAKNEEEIAYREIFAEAEQELNFRVFYNTVEERAAELIVQNLPPKEQCHFYISGPVAMVKAYQKLAQQIGIEGRRIHTDYFPGF